MSLFFLLVLSVAVVNSSTTSGLLFKKALFEVAFSRYFGN